jgi:hypothetical protein
VDVVNVTEGIRVGKTLLYVCSLYHCWLSIVGF